MQPQRETVIYKTTMPFTAASRYRKDLKHRQKQGWSLISCTETGKDLFGRSVLTAIYEHPGTSQASMPTLTIPNLPLLLSMLSPDEKTAFESEVAAVANRWLARKTRG